MFGSALLQPCGGGAARLNVEQSRKLNIGPVITRCHGNRWPMVAMETQEAAHQLRSHQSDGGENNNDLRKLRHNQLLETLMDSQRDGIKTRAKLNQKVKKKVKEQVKSGHEIKPQHLSLAYCVWFGLKPLILYNFLQT